MAIILSDMNAELQALKARCTKTAVLKQGLMHAMRNDGEIYPERPRSKTIWRLGVDNFT